MAKTSTTVWNSGAYTSPGTPDNYADDNVGEGFPKGWYSERVQLPMSRSRRHISASALIPFNSGRALPSKWDDAERWITSPLSACRTPVVQPQRRLKSKSGPVGNLAVTTSPAVLVIEGGKAKGFMVGSPLTTGVLVPDGLSVHYGGGIGIQVNPIYAENSIDQSSNVGRWTDSLSDSSLPGSRDEKLGGTEDQEAMESQVVSRRNMATQMSPDGSQSGRSSFAASRPSVLPTTGPHSKVEVKDVQVDKRATMIKQSRKDVTTMTKKDSLDNKNLASAWHVAQKAKKPSRSQREEAKISAWENLQKAKAEAAIKKLEMKLEKKRSASMKKILNKLRKAQTKAQDLRGSMSDNVANKPPKSKLKVVSFRKYATIGSFSGCFTSHTK